MDDNFDEGVYEDVNPEDLEEYFKVFLDDLPDDEIPIPDEPIFDFEDMIDG